MEEGDLIEVSMDGKEWFERVFAGIDCDYGFETYINGNTAGRTCAWKYGRSINGVPYGSCYETTEKLDIPKEVVQSVDYQGIVDDKMKSIRKTLQERIDNEIRIILSMNEEQRDLYYKALNE